MAHTIWNIEEMTGYKPMTTFWSDFCIAEDFGTNGIQDTFNRAFKEWRTNAKYITEFTMVLNHKIWYWYNIFESNMKKGILDSQSQEFSILYDKLWRQSDEWCMNNLKKDDLQYYIQTTD